MMHLRNKELITWMKQELELHYAYPLPIKLMTINGFGILLILVERIKRDISKLENVFNEPPVGLEQQMN